jgi:hypothetical protein
MSTLEETKIRIDIKAKALQIASDYFAKIYPGMYMDMNGINYRAYFIESELLATAGLNKK